MRGTQEVGLAFPADLGAWRRWAGRRHPVISATRTLRARARPDSPATGSLHLPSGPARTLVVLDPLTPSCRHALQAPLRHLDPETTAVLTADPDALGAGSPPGVPWTSVEQLPAELAVILSAGEFTPLAAQVVPWARRRGARSVVVQHGLLTRYSPPLADGDHLLAWSSDDARYWTAGRSAVTSEVVGAQLLWASARRRQLGRASGRPLLLGQLHGTELARRDLARIYLTFCRRHDVDYRPHPNEADVSSRLVHRMLDAGGVQFERSGLALEDLGRPVVSVFSTGTLEMAQRGLPAWVTHPDPPPWVRDLWTRYRLAEWGGPPTPPWPQPATEPAEAVAAAVARELGR